MYPLVDFIVNYAKVALVWLADAINQAFDPFHDFTRPEELRYHEWLHEKEAQFSVDMGVFWWPERSTYRHKLPNDAGDQALWHGVYTAMWAMKHSVTGGELDRLKACAEGLMQHQTPTPGLPKRLIRGWNEDGTYQDDVSNDQATGHILGIYFLWKYGDGECRDMATELAENLAYELLFHEDSLIGADGEPTTHGRLVNGHLTDPLRLTLALAIYAVAAHLTSSPSFAMRYDDLVKRFGPILPYANVELLWWKKSHHAHRAAIHYSILCDLEKDHGTHRRYLAGLLRTWRMERKSGNPWIYYLMRRVCLYDPAHEERVKIHLKEMYLENKQWNVEKINSDEVETFKWGGKTLTKQPLPRWRVGSHDFLWQRQMFSADDWIGNRPGMLGLVRHNTGDFLAAYWGLRSLRLIGEDE